jgi:asparagine N-glycosylation enzyme membrane subunit Stt3
MSELSPERKRVVVLCASVAAMSGVSVLLKGHPVLLGVWIAFMVVTLVYAMVQLAKLKGQGR